LQVLRLLTQHVARLRFWGDRRLRHVHSFPTRRSSDLVLGVHDAAGLLFKRLDPFRLGIPFPADEVELTLAAADLRRQAGRGFTADRKSTRLNSSHGSISYAVFCLKKKITRARLTSP